MTRLAVLRAANLAILILFPVAWFAPLLRAGFIRPWNVPWTDWTFFELDVISVASGLQALWVSAPFLCVVVTFAAIVAPVAKIIATDCVITGRMPPRMAPLLFWAGRFAMADIFLLALYVLLFKGMGVGEIAVGWGLYLFTLCVTASIVVAVLAERETGRETGHKMA